VQKESEYHVFVLNMFCVISFVTLSVTLFEATMLVT